METHVIAVNLIDAIHTDEGLEVHCWLDKDDHCTGRKVTDSEMGKIK